MTILVEACCTEHFYDFDNFRFSDTNFRKVMPFSDYGIGREIRVFLFIPSIAHSSDAIVDISISKST